MILVVNNDAMDAMDDICAIMDDFVLFRCILDAIGVAVMIIGCYMLCAVYSVILNCNVE